jgi:hypothetical protein
MLRPVLTVLVLLLLAVPASANTISQTFGFECLTNAAACPGGEGEVELTITHGAAGEVVFTLDFVGVSALGLQAVYFEANPLLVDIVSVTHTADVGFVIGGQPKVPAVLPGGDASSWPLMVSTIGEGAGAPEYVTSGEQLVIVVSHAPAAFPEDVLAALFSGDFRVGILLGDDGLVTVPEPMLLGLLGIAGLAFAGRRRTV